MGWSFRKSFNFGGLRVNLSRSGVGISAGVKGFRVSLGPRGTYLNAGLGGIYFRQRLDAPPHRRRRSSTSTAWQLDEGPQQLNPDVGVSALAIPTADVGQLADPNSGELIREIRKRYAITALAPLICWTATILVASGIIVGLALHAAGWVVAIGTVVAASPVAILLHRRDLARKTVVLSVELSSTAEERFEIFDQTIRELARVRGMWRISVEGFTEDSKRSAGANVVTTRTIALFARKLPPWFKSNIRPFALVLSDQTLFFFPDRVIVYDGRNIGAVSYAQLEVDVSTISFRETARVPPDADVVDHTWQYVNRDGGPDRRYKHNARIPICQYDELTLRSDTGLNIRLLLSKPGAANRFRDAEAELIPICQSAAATTTNAARIRPSVT
ncbi:MAG: DUF4236 domain-containing protein [Phycisphaerales bacterium]|nr:DUF4236 domain-containing protein [Phycisphaerales bacterium]